MNENSPAPCCGSCHCYRADPLQLQLGTCHCLPPVPMFVNQGGVPGLISIAPPVAAGGYCHQWRALPAAANDDLTAGPAIVPPITPSWEPPHGP